MGLYFDEAKELDPNVDLWVGGGTNEAMWWIGGPTLTADCLIWPKSAYTRRPMDFRSAAMVEETCKKRLEKDMQLSDDPKSKVLLTSWIAVLNDFLRKLDRI